MAAATAEGGKNLLALLNGIARHDYYGDAEVTDDFLKQELYPAASQEEYATLLQKMRGIVKSMAMADMDPAQVDAFLLSQTKKRGDALPEEHAKVLQRFWKAHRARVHDSLVAACRWNNRLARMSWRIDVESRTRASPQPISVPCAIVEMQLERNAGGDGAVVNSEKSGGEEVVRFEMNESGMASMLQSLRDIEQLIEQHSSSQTMPEDAVAANKDSRPSRLTNHQ